MGESHATRTSTTTSNSFVSSHKNLEVAYRAQLGAGSSRGRGPTQHLTTGELRPLRFRTPVVLGVPSLLSFDTYVDSTNPVEYATGYPNLTHVGAYLLMIC